MNILIPNSWLKEYIKTDATPKQIGEYLSLCSQSVEKINTIDNDSIYDIEITGNRPDCLSVYGIARELAAILPRFGLKTVMMNSFQHPQPILKKFQDDELKLDVKITDSSLCPRFTAIILDNIKLGPSPKIVQERLLKVNSRPINNVVDISNYLMFALGQPIHTFDYDKIANHKMILRESKKGESLVTLDGQKRDLPEGTIVIEDGSGKSIDLCGIMGGENSAVDDKTKRVLLFVQTYNPGKIRKTCQQLSFRTEASTRFEKGIEPEGVIPTINEAIKMFEENCGGKVLGNLIDIYPNPAKPLSINLDLSLVNNLIGVEIPKKEIIEILISLGFFVLGSRSSVLTVGVPHWRTTDISIAEDLVEEVARIYGYFKLPSILPNGRAVIKSDSKFSLLQQIKTALKYWGLTEVATYSLVSHELLTKNGFDPNKCLQISNPLSEEWIYLRPSLIPSHLEVIEKNNNQEDKISIFEISNIYISNGTNKLPDEIPVLTMTFYNKKFLEAKGIVEALLSDLNIDNAKYVSKDRNTLISINKKIIGQIKSIKNSVIISEIDFNSLLKLSNSLKTYKPVSLFPAVVEDLSLIVPDRVEVGKILEAIKSVDHLISNVEYLNSYENTQSYRITYQSNTKTLSGEEVSKIRSNILKTVNQKFKASLKI